MPTELTNLLPSERQRLLRRSYSVRLGIIAAWMLSFLVLTAAVLLVPTYVYVVRSVEVKREQLKNVAGALQSSDETALSTRLAALTSDAQRLSKLKNAPTASAALRSVLVVPHPEVQLLSFTYTPNDAKRPRTLAVSGSADTRAALRNYQIALETNPLVKSSQLPVSTYAKETDIPFTITLTLETTP